MPIKEVEIHLTAGWQRLGVLVLVAGALVWVLVRLSAQARAAQLANLVGDVASLQAALAADPSQAEVHSRLGLYYLYDPVLFDPAGAVAQLEAAVRLQPFAASGWAHLARGYEQQGDLARAQQAYGISLELAPNHFEPHWLYANFLIRHDQRERALPELDRAAQIDPEAMGNICELIWQTMEHPAPVLVQFGQHQGSGYVRGRISQFLVNHGQYQSAVALWRTVAVQDPAQLPTGRALVSALIGAGQWAWADGIWREVVQREYQARGQPISPQAWAFWNGGFEQEDSAGGFDWQLSSSGSVAARLDTGERYEGSRSLELEFIEHQEVSFSGVTHDLPVEPSSRYRLRFYYKADGLPERNGVAVVLSEVGGAERWSRRWEAPGPVSQWSEQEMEFETPPATRLVRLQIQRQPTGRLYDYIEGKVWFDAFTLELRGRE
jgi:hypothetical protein